VNSYTSLFSGKFTNAEPTPAEYKSDPSQSVGADA